jgi:hypothetical protein
MRSATVALCIVLLTGITFAGSPETAPEPDPSIPLFRVEAAEVRISLSAFDRQNLPVGDLKIRDLHAYRDGRTAEIVALKQYRESPIAAAVLTDISSSMNKALPLARESWKWMLTRSSQPGDQIEFYDFDNSIAPAAMKHISGTNLTSLYDGLVDFIPRVKPGSSGRRALILFTDGQDNSSYHVLDDVINAASREDVVIYAITPFVYPVRYNSEVLTRLSSGTGGRFFLVSDTEEMIVALKLIEQDLREGYELILRSDKSRQAGLRRLSIESDRPLRLHYRNAYYQPATQSTVQIVASR